MKPLPEVRKALHRIKIALVLPKNSTPKNYKVCYVQFFLPFEQKFQSLVEEGLMPRLTKEQIGLCNRGGFIARQNLQTKKTPLRTQRYTFAPGIGSPSKTIFCD